MSDSYDQDKLAEEWAAALAEDDGQEAQAPEAAAETPAEAPGDAAAAEGGDETLAAEWAAALAEDEAAAVSAEKQDMFDQAQGRVAEFKDLTQEARAPRPEDGKRDLDFILDIPLEVSAELGRTKLLINELLQLGQGSVVELNKLAGEPLEVFVNGKLVARGEAVVINEKFGVRLTDIISPIERVKQLG